MVDQQKIEAAARMLLEAAPGSKVILFGSHARGDAASDSDVDFLVIEPEVRDRHAEMVRLANVLRPLMLPVDVLVVSEERFGQATIEYGYRRRRTSVAQASCLQRTSLAS